MYTRVLLYLEYIHCKYTNISNLVFYTFLHTCRCTVDNDWFQVPVRQGTCHFNFSVIIIFC
jgi:hypothetical protein